MARIARVVVPGYPHHVTQRGNRRQQTFFSDSDYIAYKAILKEWCGLHSVAIWAYCLMPNHVHIIAAPSSEEGLARAIGETHRRYTRRINFREGWRGYLWQGRFSSFVMDNDHLLATVRYIALNPVRAGLVRNPQEWQWGSACANLLGKNDNIVGDNPIAGIIQQDWDSFLEGSINEEIIKSIRSHERTGRPLGSNQFVEKIGMRLNRSLTIKKPGRKPKLINR